MPVAKLKCKWCKEYASREQIIKVNVGNFCCDDHLTAFALDKRNQQAAKSKIVKEAYSTGGRKKGKTTKDCENDRKTRKKAAKEACHAYIRERDKADTCICCGEPLKPGYQAGHYIPSGQNPRIRYDPDNIHGQNLNCNYFRGGDSGQYRENLIKKIGLKRVLRLESLKGGTDTRTPQQLKRIELYFKRKKSQLIGAVK